MIEYDSIERHCCLTATRSTPGQSKSLSVWSLHVPLFLLGVSLDTLVSFKNSVNVKDDWRLTGHSGKLRLCKVGEIMDGWKNTKESQECIQKTVGPNCMKYKSSVVPIHLYPGGYMVTIYNMYFAMEILKQMQFFAFIYNRCVLSNLCNREPEFPNGNLPRGTNKVSIYLPQAELYIFIVV